MKKIGFLLIVVSMFFIASSADAALLYFNPFVQDVSLGETATIDFNISGLGDFEAPSLGSYDFDIGFDSSILSFNSISFGDQLSFFEVSDRLETPGTGTVNVYEVSWDWPEDLIDLQADSFTLFSLTFDTMAVGSDTLTLNVNDFSDQDAELLGIDWTILPTINVERSAAVPEPASMLLFGLGAVGAFIKRRRA